MRARLPRIHCPAASGRPHALGVRGGARPSSGLAEAGQRASRWPCSRQGWRRRARAHAAPSGTEPRATPKQGQEDKDDVARTFFSAMPGVQSYKAGAWLLQGVHAHTACTGCRTRAANTRGAQPRSGAVQPQGTLFCVQGPPPDQLPAPFGLVPDLDDGPGFQDAFDEEDPELRCAATPCAQGPAKVHQHCLLRPAPPLRLLAWEQC